MEKLPYYGMKAGQLAWHLSGLLVRYLSDRALFCGVRSLALLQTYTSGAWTFTRTIPVRVAT
jgi:hypothetical protein